MYGIILIGRPGSGKSMIGKELAKEYGYRYISSGDIARELAKSDIGTANNLKNGEMANEDLMRNEIYNTIWDCIIANKSFILDGFPRSMEQYEWLKQFDIRFIYVEIFTSSLNSFFRCRSRGREIDDIINKRIKYYRENTNILLQFCSITIDNNVDKDIKYLVELLYKEVNKIVNNCKI